MLTFGKHEEEDSRGMYLGVSDSERDSTFGYQAKKDHLQKNSKLSVNEIEKLLKDYQLVNSKQDGYKQT